MDHFPCKAGETALSWSGQGRDGVPGVAGTDGHDGSAGPAGPAGHDGVAGHDGLPGTAGSDGAAGPTGPAGPTGATGAPGPQGIPGATGPQGPAGPAGTSASGGGGTLLAGRVTNNADPDCVMTASQGVSTAGPCSMTPLRTLGSLLPTATTVTGFSAWYDRSLSGGHIYAMTVDTNARATDVFLLCTIPAGTNLCTQTAPVDLTGQRLFGLEFDGDRSWSSVNYGYVLSPR